MAQDFDERDLVLEPNRFAYILDKTKGHVQVYVGPHKSSPAGTDQPVLFDPNTKNFVECSLEKSKQTWVTAPEGWYTVLKNPATEPTREHPRAGAIESLPELGIGRKINTRGPISFPLWPGQMARVIKGHHLRSNQFLLVRVYDEDAAKDNWSKGVVKGREGDEVGIPVTLPDLTIGKLLVIKGTEVSFYIPPTGVEVVPDSGSYVRDAVTLENLEYAILLDEDGNKSFIYGPDVVFPMPTQTFVEKDGQKKFRVVELNGISGIYVKVIQDYIEDGKTIKAGSELWITGKDQAIYYPRPEHGIIKYGDQTIYYAVVIPKGEGRYLLNRDTGDIDLVRGPDMLLPDPRTHVIARRVLPEKAVSLWFPGNKEALQYNRHLTEMIANETGKGGSDFITDEAYKNSTSRKMKGLVASNMTTASGTALNRVDLERLSGYMVEPTDNIVGEDFDRKQKFTPPRTVTLDSKYDGAVRIDVFTGYAVLVKSATGQRKVVVGPDTVLLEYDETLEAFELSKGNPKSADNVIKDVYLRVKNNKISDSIEVETNDMCNITLQLSYRVNFEGDPEKWFDVENYVQFLVDHMRSLLKNLIRQYDVKTFYGNPTAIIRDAILGASVDGVRKGRVFEENGMRVYDAEVLSVVLDDQGIEESLIHAQQEAIKNALLITSKEQELERVQKSEEIQRQIDTEMTSTVLTKVELALKKSAAEHLGNMQKLSEKVRLREEELKRQKEEQEAINEINEVELVRSTRLAETEATNQKLKDDLKLSYKKALTDLELAVTLSDVEAVKEKMKALEPGFVEALQVLGDKELATKIAESMSWSRLIGGENPGDMIQKLLSGTNDTVQKAVKKLAGMAD
jgi:major vault protein